MFLIVIILKIIGWIIMIPTLLLYGFIESSMDLGINIKRIQLKNIIRMVFLPIITLLALALMGLAVGGIFLIVYFGLVFLFRSLTLNPLREFRMKKLLQKFKEGKLSDERTIKKILRILRKDSKIKRLMVRIISNDVSLRINIPLFLGVMVLKIIPKSFLKRKSNMDVDPSLVFKMLNKMRNDEKVTVFVNSSSGEIVKIRIG
ncbi:MAG TPA: hypothetical protein ENF81_00295 [Thermotogaceae bacterium]|nr:hypothetical protein [Thermotogaceae bacterium]